jgi:prepilin-type N-terminal cleavage/methylation domain-containing protein
MYRRGFTIVELLIVIALMGILLTLGVANLRGTQANSRDAQRKGDITNIALSLETYYNSGNGTTTQIGQYPSTAMIGNETTTLPNLDPQSLLAPNQTTDSLIAATNNVQTTTGVTATATITTNTYVYQPLTQANVLCTGTMVCQKFNLYYETEVDNTIHMVMSKNQ